MLITILLCFLVAFLVLFLGDSIKSSRYRLIGLFPLSLFLFFATHLYTVCSGEIIIDRHQWIPTLGVDLNLKLDGLSLLFSLLITGIGSLIFFYASYYLKGYHYLNRFYCYLTMFMGAMLGLVLSDNLISVFIFWELTSISSFFLIGFNHEDEASRKSAITALGITGLGGFFLLAGFLLIYLISDTYSIHELLNSADLIQENSLFPAILFLIFVGAFTKSAQFPFHFWLPGAMQAPTPISAYLHSATMVKAGIYILARLFPVLEDGILWNNTLMLVGGITMFYGAFHSILRVDMKSILAYSTISALGILIFLLGIGNQYAVYAVAVFILVHALYKAALFLITGIVDHTVHTRDISKISGLSAVMPQVYAASIVAALSSAGVPLMFGFISKDLIYESTLHLPQWAIWATGIAVLTNILLACSGLMVGVKPFVGKPSHSSLKTPHKLLWIPVVILSSFSVLFGVFPFIADYLLQFTFLAINDVSTSLYLKLWHGFTSVFLLSVITIVGGYFLYILKKNSPQTIQFLSKFDVIAPKNIIEQFGLLFRKIAFQYTRFFHNGYLRNYILTIIIFFIVLVGYRLFTTTPIQINTEGLSGFRLYELTIFIIILVAIFFTIYTSSRLTAIASLGIIGYCICLIFVFYGAPDLAMTQFTIDTLTVVLFVLVLFKLPRFLPYRNKKILWRDTIVSIAFGTLILLITLQALVSPAEKETSKFYAENAYLLAKGKNVVNVILVDFRGFDTMIETIVLSIAALGVYSLLKYKTSNHEESE
ncbi:MAG: proton-conducting transporter membrane subunit [Bacteroidota bacterium]|nr:proton-conducting transporter membrane subunit [Bacteroidota bacterium]